MRTPSSEDARRQASVGRYLLILACSLLAAPLFVLFVLDRGCAAGGLQPTTRCRLRVAERTAGTRTRAQDWHAAGSCPCCLRQTKAAEQASCARGLTGSAALTEVDLRFEVGARVGVGERLLELHLAALEERVQRLVEALDTALGALVDGFLDRHHVAFLDQGGDVGGVQHDLDGSHPPALLAHH